MAFDANRDGLISRDECVGRLCGVYGSKREQAEELFERLDSDGSGNITIDAFLSHYELIQGTVGGEFPPRADQLPTL